MIGETNYFASFLLKFFYLSISVELIKYLNLSLDSDLDF